MHVCWSRDVIFLKYEEITFFASFSYNPNYVPMIEKLYYLFQNFLWQHKADLIHLHCISDRARNIETGEIVALKKMRMEQEKEGKSYFLYLFD